MAKGYAIGVGASAERIAEPGTQTCICMDIELTGQQLGFVKQQLDAFALDLGNLVLNPVHQVLQYKSVPPATQDFLQRKQNLVANLAQPMGRETMFVLGEGVGPMLKLVILARRRAVASDVDMRRAKTTNPEVIATLNGELSHFDSILQQAWAKRTDALKMPRLSDFLTLEEVEKVLDQRGSRLPPRQYDEKFHLLQAPGQLGLDLHYFREACEARGVPLVIAYLDIDDFKRLNTTHGHVAVDQNVLPVFMSALEHFAFARGYAYRLSGDEYALLLPNGFGAEKIVPDLLRIVQDLWYGSITERTTISVGLCAVEPDSPFTDLALEERANRAMRFAKDAGKNCVATFKGTLLLDEDLYRMNT